MSLTPKLKLRHYIFWWQMGMYSLSFLSSQFALSAGQQGHVPCVLLCTKYRCTTSFFCCLFLFGCVSHLLVEISSYRWLDSDKGSGNCWDLCFIAFPTSGIPLYFCVNLCRENCSGCSPNGNLPTNVVFCTALGILCCDFCFELGVVPYFYMSSSFNYHLAILN